MEIKTARRPDVTRNNEGKAISVVITEGEWQMFFTLLEGKVRMPFANTKFFGRNLAGEVPQNIFCSAIRQAAAILKPSQKNKK